MIKNCISLLPAKMVLLILLALSSLCVSAQGYDKNWVFGRNTQIDFSTSPPTMKMLPFTAAAGASADPSYDMNSYTSISDSNGVLLFYTAGQYLFNGYTNALVKNNLNTTIDATQGSIVVPKPGTLNQYYLFSVDAIAASCGFASNGSGRGVTVYTITVDNANKTVICDAGATLVSGVVNGQAACVASNGIDYWYIVHSKANAGAFMVYKITASGISLHQTITVGPAYTGCFNMTMKFNSCITQLAVATLTDITLYAFDGVTGILSAPSIYKPAILDAYGLEFSPNGKYLYYTVGAGGSVTGAIYCFNNVNTGTLSSPVKLAAVDNTTTPNDGVAAKSGQLQLGPDGNIYVANKPSYNLALGTNKNYLGVILNPNTATPTYNATYLYVSDPNAIHGVAIGMGLPTFTRSYVYNPVSFLTDNVVLSASTELCQGSSVVLTIDASGTAAGNALWTIDGVNSTSAFDGTGKASITYTFNKTGNIPVKVSITDNCGRMRDVKTTITVSSYMSPTYAVACASKPVMRIMGTGIGGSAGVASNYLYYDAAVNGNLLGAGATYDWSGPFPKSVWIESGSLSVPKAMVGETSANFSSTIYPNGGWTQKQAFTLKRKARLFSVDVKVIDPNGSGSCTNNYTVIIKAQQAGVDIAGMTVATTTSGCNKIITVPLNFLLASGTYDLVVTISSASLKFSLKEYGTTSQTWTDANGVITISGSTSNGWAQSGPFGNWVVGVPYSCENRVPVTIIDNCTTTSVNDQVNNSTQLKVYPNPGNGIFTVESGVAGNYSIINELGQTIQRVELNEANDLKVHISNLHNGVYFIHGYNNSQLTTQKIVIAK